MSVSVLRLGHHSSLPVARVNPWPDQSYVDLPVAAEETGGNNQGCGVFGRHRGLKLRVHGVRRQVRSSR